MKTPLSPENEKWINFIINNSKLDDLQVLKEDDEKYILMENMRKLQEGIWLDDAVINFYIRVCLRECDKELCHINGNKRLHFFSMKFISLMWNDQLKNKANRWKMEYNNVDKWSKNVLGGKLFKLKYVFCPIKFENKHWACAVILMEEKRIKYYNSGKHANTKWRKMKNKPFVPDIMAGLVEYLMREAEKVDKVILPDKEWTIAIMVETLFQKNGSDVVYSYMCFANCT
jgi:Ulp1 family protease